MHASLNLFAKARLDGRLFEQLADGITQWWADKPAVCIWGTEDPILIIEPVQKDGLLSVLAKLMPIKEGFGDMDESLLALDDVEF